MAYIRGGELQTKRSIWRLSIFTDMFWTIVFYFKMFFTTMFSMEASNAYRKPKSDRRSGSSGGWGGGSGGGGAPPPGNPGTGTGTGPRRFGEMSDIRGVDHNVACGSCCS